jgi:hypothetical protein
VGLTKREYFEARAMQGILSNPAMITFEMAATDQVKLFELIANLARQGAEALLNGSDL